MSDTPKRRWLPRYSLRTLIVAITLFAIATGYIRSRLHWIQARHNLLAEEDAKDNTGRWGYVCRIGNPPIPRAPGLLWVFGESGRVVVDVFVSAYDKPQLSAADKARLKLAANLFPVADIYTRFEHDVGLSALQDIGRIEEPDVPQ